MPQWHLAQVSLRSGRFQENSAVKGLRGLGWKWSSHVVMLAWEFYPQRSISRA